MGNLLEKRKYKKMDEELSKISKQVTEGVRQMQADGKMTKEEMEAKLDLTLDRIAEVLYKRLEE